MVVGGGGQADIPSLLAIPSHPPTHSQSQSPTHRSSKLPKDLSLFAYSTRQKMKVAAERRKLLRKGQQFDDIKGGACEGDGGGNE